MACVVEPSMNSRLSSMYNECLRSKDGIQQLNMLIMEAEKDNLHSKELAVCYAFRADAAIENQRFEEAYEDLERAKRMYPNGVEIIHGLINVHWRAKDRNQKNRHVNDILCVEYTKHLEMLGRDDARILDFCSRVYASLNMFDDGLRCLSQARALLMKQEGFAGLVCEMNKSMTSMHLNRYETCPDEENLHLVSCLVDLLDFEENTLGESEKNQAFSELLERLQFVVSEQSSSLEKQFQPHDEGLLRKALSMLSFDGIGITSDVLDLGRQIFVILKDAGGGVEYMTKCLSSCKSSSNHRAEILLSRSCFYEQLGDTSRSHKDFISSNGDGTGLGASKFVLIKSQIGNGWREAKGQASSSRLDEEKTREELQNEVSEETADLRNRIASLESELRDVRRMNDVLTFGTGASTSTKGGETEELKLLVQESEQIMKDQARDIRLRDEVIQDLRVEATCSSEYVETLCQKIDRLTQDNERLTQSVHGLKKNIEALETRLEQGEKSSCCKRVFAITLRLLAAILTFVALVAIIFIGSAGGLNADTINEA